MKDKALYVLMGLFVIILSLLLLSYNDEVPTKEISKKPIVSPAVDEHGCVISTGYVWSEKRGYCVESLDDDCPKEYKPVCGMNGVTYGNSCKAGSEKIVRFGVC